MYEYNSKMTAQPTMLNQNIFTCLERGCNIDEYPKRLKIVKFIRHLRRVHNRRMIIHHFKFRTNVDYEVWIRYVHEHFFPNIEEYGLANETWYRCEQSQIGGVSNCTFGIYTRRYYGGNKNKLKKVKVMCIGEHHGHFSKPSVECQHFCLDYNAFRSSPMHHWMGHFLHGGIIIENYVTPLSNEVNQCLGLTKSMNVKFVGFMTLKQIHMFRLYKNVLYFEFYAEWLVIYCVTADKEKSVVEFPVAFFYSNNVGKDLTALFVTKLKEICGPGGLDSEYIITNSLVRCKKLWCLLNLNENRGSITHFVQAFTNVSVTVKHLLPDNLSLREFLFHSNELEQCVLEHPDDVESAWHNFIYGSILEFDEDFDDDLVIDVETSVTQWYRNLASFRDNLPKVMFNDIQRFTLLGTIMNESLPVVINKVLLYSRIRMNEVMNLGCLDTKYTLH